MEGAWWPEDYRGEPLVSFEVELGRALGLKIGDKITVNVLGRNVTAKLANFRTVRMGFAEHQFRHDLLAEHAGGRALQHIGDAELGELDDQAGEAEVVRAVAAEFPTRHLGAGPGCLGNH